MEISLSFTTCPNIRAPLLGRLLSLSSCLSPLQKVGFCNPQVGHCLPNVTPDEHAFHVACQLREWLCGFVIRSGDIRGWLLPSSDPAHLTILRGFILASALFLPSC